MSIRNVNHRLPNRATCSAMSDKALREAIERAGGIRALGRLLGIAHQSIPKWKQTPPLRVLEIERLTGVSRHRLRPDLYPPVKGS